jgi:hypothetical protein
MRNTQSAFRALAATADTAATTTAAAAEDTAAVVGLQQRLFPSAVPQPLLGRGSGL